MKQIQFSVTYPDYVVHPLQHRIMRGTSISRIELLMWSPTEDPTTLFWCDGERDVAESVIRSIESLLVSHLVEDSDGTYVFLRQKDYEFPAPLLDLISGSQVIFLPPVIFLETGEIQFEAVGETTALSTFYDDLSELGDPTIEHVLGFERKHSSSHLTERQREALDVAVSVGYYEIPRNGTVADIAATLNCSTSTAGELVRKAESKVIHNITEKRN